MKQHYWMGFSLFIYHFLFILIVSFPSLFFLFFFFFLVTQNLCIEHVEHVVIFENSCICNLTHLPRGNTETQDSSYCSRSKTVSLQQRGLCPGARRQEVPFCKNRSAEGKVQRPAVTQPCQLLSNNNVQHQSWSMICTHTPPVVSSSWVDQAGKYSGYYLPLHAGSKQCRASQVWLFPSLLVCK